MTAQPGFACGTARYSRRHGRCRRPALGQSPLP